MSSLHIVSSIFFFLTCVSESLSCEMGNASAEPKDLHYPGVASGVMIECALIRLIGGPPLVPGDNTEARVPWPCVKPFTVSPATA